MNQEKIKELALEANLEYNVFLPDAWTGESKDLEKFAELILNECQNVISEVYREMPLETCGWLLHLEEKVLDRFYNEMSLEPCRAISQLLE